MMREQEKERHLLILIIYTLFTIALIGESYLMGWEASAVLLLLLGVIGCWVAYITRCVATSIQLWANFILTMLATFFYGSHETSIYDLAPFVIMIIILYSALEKPSFIRICVGTYFFTIFYDFLFVKKAFVKIDALTITRLMLHFVLVIVAGYLSNMAIQRHNKDKKEMGRVIEELEETNRRTEDFLTNVSHELRTPINVVTGITAMMLKNEKDNSKRKDILTVQEAGYRLFEQIEDILDYTEIDTGRIKLSEDSYMISSVINDMMARNRLSEKKKHLELIFDVDAGIPSVLVGDVKKIKKILTHLIDNAYKFTEEGGICVRVYAIPKQYGINLCIKVCDTGIGISNDDLGKIVGQFYQSNGGRNRRAGGLGLGLSIVYGLVNAMEGFMQIESAEGQGTTVSISIPQKIFTDSPCMALENKDGICVGCLLDPDKYPSPEVRSFYNDAILHLMQGLELTLHRVSNIDELENLRSRYQLTHLIVGEEEYREHESVLQELNLQLEVLQKPFFALSLVNRLQQAPDGEDIVQNRYMHCPGVKVLVVDDEPMNLMVADGILKDLQMNVTTAESGREAIEICRSKEFDLILLDHMMPEMDGVETLRQLRKISTASGNEFIVIAFTANAVSGAREMFLEAGFDEFLSKPVELNELERVLKKVLPKSAIHYGQDVEVPSETDGEDVVETATEENATEETATEETVSEEDEDSFLESLEKQGFHTHEGMQYSMNDRNFYRQILLKFSQGHDSKEEELNRYLAEEDYENYRILVHSLKSSSKLIGANELSEMAKNLETAAAQRDCDYLRENHGPFLDRYRLVVKSIEGVLSPDEVALHTELEEISGEALIAKLQELNQVLQSFEIDRTEALLAELSNITYHGKSGEEMLEGISCAVEDFDFEKAAAETEQLIHNVEGSE